MFSGVFFSFKMQKFLSDMTKADDLLEWLKDEVNEKKSIQLHDNYATAVVSVFDGHYSEPETVPLPVSLLKLQHCFI